MKEIKKKINGDEKSKTGQIKRKYLVNERIGSFEVVKFIPNLENLVSQCGGV